MCPTRWGSTQHMISRVLRNKKAIRRVLGDDKDTSHLVPKWEDLDVLECIDKAIGPLKEFTDIMSASKYVTVSALKPILHRLSTTELARQDGDLPLVVEIKEEVLRRLKSRYLDPSMEILMNIASFLDPRYKTDFLAVETNNDENALTQLDKVKEEFLKNAVFLARPLQDQENDVLPVPVPKKAKLSLGALTSLKKPETMSPAASPRDRLSKEIETYVSLPVVDGDDDPLRWWKLNDHKLPMLGQLARRYLAIQATSSPSERLFSKAGQVSTPARAQLKPEKVDQLVFLAENL